MMMHSNGCSTKGMGCKGATGGSLLVPCWLCLQVLQNHCTSCDMEGQKKVPKRWDSVQLHS